MGRFCRIDAKTIIHEARGGQVAASVILPAGIVRGHGDVAMPRPSPARVLTHGSAEYPKGKHGRPGGDIANETPQVFTEGDTVIRLGNFA